VGAEGEVRSERADLVGASSRSAARSTVWVG
jgi:hypothetical protein